jgi:hypothetical protein
LFDRGFKTWCEKTSLEIRRKLHLSATDALDPRALALELKISVRGVSEIKGVSADALEALSARDSGWSAVTIEITAAQKKMILLNDSHSVARQSSDLTHELAHHVCGHKPSSLEVSAEGLMMLESYSRKDEEEADWLAGCLLLPRPALIHIKRRFPDERAAANIYQVSQAMLRYRLDVTGVNYQYRKATDKAAERQKTP